MVLHTTGVHVCNGDTDTTITVQFYLEKRGRSSRHFPIGELCQKERFDWSKNLGRQMIDVIDGRDVTFRSGQLLIMVDVTTGNSLVIGLRPARGTFSSISM